jgi:hypothetical protein
VTDHPLLHVALPPRDLAARVHELVVGPLHDHPSESRVAMASRRAL